MDADWAKIAVDIGQFGLLAAVGLHQWLMGRDRVRREQLSALEDEVERVIDDHSSRIVRVESKIESTPTGTHCAVQMARLSTLEEAVRRMPGQETIARIHQRIDNIAETSAEVRGTLRKLEEMVARMDRYLMGHSEN